MTAPLPLTPPDLMPLTSSPLPLTLPNSDAPHLFSSPQWGEVG